MRDQFGIVPPEIRAMAEAEEAVDRQVGTARYLDKALKAKDPNLGLVFVKDVPEWDLPVGAVAGRWHIQVKSERFVPTYIPILGPNGEFREPASDVLEMAERLDLRKPEVFREVMERDERKKAERRKAAGLRDEQRKDELVSDLKAAKRVIGEGRYSDGRLKPSKWGKK